MIVLKCCRCGGTDLSEDKIEFDIEEKVRCSFCGLMDTMLDCELVEIDDTEMSLYLQ